MAHHIGSTLKPLVRLGRSPADCWEWLGAIDSDGHARKEHAGRSITAARWIWLMFFGPIPAGLVITTAPTCGNKACGNPFHLRCCHQADANRAAVHVTLLPSDVIEIKRARKDKTPCTAGILAERYGCSKVTIHEIWGGRTWRAKKAPNYGPQRAIA